MSPGLLSALGFHDSRHSCAAFLNAAARPMEAMKDDDRAVESTPQVGWDRPVRCRHDGKPAARVEGIPLSERVDGRSVTLGWDDRQLADAPPAIGAARRSPTRDPR